ncbi:cache domain-containing sensor histidine kinase [Paenibacillus sp. 481]|uniref:cache domain-containing sensor histidine kinase n=1 Tax=Paenibacillus sp. 481 TaxID=2835869 RepID=UPI003FA6CB11
MPSIKPIQPSYIPFGYKLLFTYITFIIIPVLIIGLVSHAIYVDSIRKQTRTNIQGTLSQIRDNITYKMEDAKRISDMLYFDYTLASNLRSYEAGWETYEKMTEYVVPKIQHALNATNRNMWMSVFMHNERLPEIYERPLEEGDPESKGRDADIFHLKRIAHKHWYADHPVEIYGTTLKWQQIEQDQQYKRMSLLRRLVDTSSPLRLKEIGFMRLNVPLNELFESVDYRKIGEGSILLIADNKNEILYHSGYEVSEQHIKALRHSASQEDLLVIEEPLDGVPWKLVTYVPTAIIEGDTVKVRMLTIAICLICFVVFTFVAMFISKYFSVRVTKIVSVLHAFREGDLHKRMAYNGKDEFSQIAVALNEMGQNIGELISEMYITQIQKKEAELESLQAQINPHFLYNTLSSISRLAKFGETDKLQRMVMDLAKFYRLTLNDGRSIIPVHKEFEQAGAYVAIQKIKYGDRLEVLFDVDSDVCSYDTVKLILQPFIENVLQHAWCGDRIHIRIVGKKVGDRLSFRIIDDGVGMKQERIRQIFDSRDHVNAGYGIRNVHQRIRLQYGAQYGVSIFSRPGIGTSVTITIPAVREKDSPRT